MLSIKEIDNIIIVSRDKEKLGSVEKCKNGYCYVINNKNTTSSIEGNKKPYTKGEALNYLLKYLT